MDPILDPTIDELKILSYEVKYLNTLPQKIISIREICKSEELSEKIGKNMQEIFQYIFKNGATPRGPPVAIFYKVDKKEIDVELGVPIVAPIKEKGKFKLSTTPGGKSAFTLYIGPYEKIDPAYNAIKNWVKDNGYEGTDIWWEVYCTNPQENPNPNDWKTEVYYQLK
ncbi:MAG: GyrI-like domain-containing protein [Candidatus Lokiarchaeota archaeon]|nr:GyrI-like domain-containing protein [Candidatus Lokiarchaeota archaeon]